MTNQDWREHIDGLMALLLILKEGQRAFVEDNVKPFIDLEIQTAEERGYKNGIHTATAWCKCTHKLKTTTLKKIFNPKS